MNVNAVFVVVDTSVCLGPKPLGLGELPKRMKPSQMSSLKCSCCENRIELGGRTTDRGVLARLPNEGAGLDDHEEDDR